MALPLSGVLAATLAAQVRAPRFRSLAWILVAVANGLALAAAWAARGIPFETAVGGWTPVSMTGLPLILASDPPSAAIIIGLAAAQFAAGLRPEEREVRGRHTAAALLFASLAFVAFSNSLVALVVGVGLVDFLSAIAGFLRGREHRQVITDAMFHGASSALLVVALVLYATGDNSLYLPLARVPDRLMPFITVALALRFGLAPLRATAGQFHDAHWTSQASALAGIVCMIKLCALGAQEFRAWFFALALLTAMLALSMGVISARRGVLAASISAGMQSVVLVSALVGQPGVAAVAGLAWLLGIELLVPSPFTPPARSHLLPQAGRLVGAACLIGAPLTAGFVARFGFATVWAGRDLYGAGLLLGAAVVQALLTLCVLRLLMDRTTRRADEPAQGLAPGLLGAGVLALHAAAFGILPDLAGAPPLAEMLSRQAPIGWILWLAPTVIGAVGWWLEAEWVRRFAPARQAVYGLLGLGWLHAILDGAMNRIGAPLARVFPVLESGSALMWLVVLLLIAVLVARPGGP
jgi:hypothetical protein